MKIHSVLWIDPTPCSNSFVSANNRFHAPFQFESAKECKWNSIIDLEGVISATKSPFFKVSHFNERCANLCSVTNFVSWKFQGFRVSCFIFHKNTLTVWQILRTLIIHLSQIYINSMRIQATWKSFAWFVIQKTHLKLISKGLQIKKP